jgi:hypothetical protein
MNHMVDFVHVQLVNILLEEAALSRKKKNKQFNTSSLFYTLPKIYKQMHLPA